MIYKLCYMNLEKLYLKYDYNEQSDHQRMENSRNIPWVHVKYFSNISRENVDDYS